MHTKKIISVITASAMIMGTLASCSVLSGLEKPHAHEALTDYMEALHDADYEYASRIVEDGQDAFFTAQMNDTEAELIAAILGASEYDIGEIDMGDGTASAEVTITLPDIESIADEGYSYEEFLAALADLEATEAETFEYELNKVDEAWLIEADSTEDYYNHLMDLIADLNFSALTEENALELVNTFMTDLSAGNIDAAAAMLSDPDSQLASYAQLAGTMGGFGDVLSGYFSRVDYVAEATEITDDYIIVTATGTGPDMQTILNNVLDNEDVMVPIYADYIEAMLNGDTLSYMSIASELFGALAQETAQAEVGPMETVFKVTADENGNLLLEPVSGLGLDLEIPDLTERTEYIIPAVTRLLSEGRITLDQLSNIEQITGTDLF